MTRYTKYEEDTIRVQKIWNDSHILIKYIDASTNTDEEYYDDGSLYLRKTKSPVNDNKSHLIQWYLGDEDKWLATNFGYDHGDKKYIYKFNSDLLLASLDQLTSTFHNLIVLWFTRYLIQKDRELAFDFLTRLSMHKDDWFRSEAAHYLGELGNKEGIPHLRRLSNETAKPFVRHRFDHGVTSHTKSIGERAQLSIQKLTSK